MKLVVANWKMYLTIRESVAFAKRMVRSVPKPRARIVICATAPALAPVSAVLRKTPYLLGAQDVGIARHGPYTGELAPGDLRTLGCHYVIVGHSERRRLLGESDTVVRQKLETALAAGLSPILCVGESLAERREGEAHSIVRRQLTAALKGLKTYNLKLTTYTIAYEPVWAIGTGTPATVKEAVLMHDFVRSTAKKLLPRGTKISVIYGGSVDQKNIISLLREHAIDGVLVGGASTKPSFIKMLKVVH